MPKEVGDCQKLDAMVEHDRSGYKAHAPYTVAVVALEVGPMVTAQLTDLGEQPVTIGMKVEMVTRKNRDDI